MRAAVVHEFHQPLVLEDRPTPHPGPGQVLVAVEASGLCHTDIHAAHGDWPVKPTPPFVPGHEGVGIVAEAGPGVDRVAVGDRVAVPWLGWACGACEWCASGWETLCPNQRNTGYSVDGGFADYVVADAAFVGRVPEGIDPLDAAPLTCAGVTTYKAVKVAGTRPSDLVAVYGIGGLGHLALQYAQIAGGTVVAVDVVDHKLQVAKELGAAHTVNGHQEDPAEVIQRLGGADQAIVLAPTPTACEQAFRSLRRGGRLVFVGLPKDNEMRAADLPDRPVRHHRDRIDRRHPGRSRRDLRAPRRRAHQGRARATTTRGCERRHQRDRAEQRRCPHRLRPSGRSVLSAEESME